MTNFVLTPLHQKGRPAPERVRAVLLDLAKDADGERISVDHATIARAAECARETASRELSRLARSGVIRQGYGGLTVDRAALAAVMA